MADTFAIVKYSFGSHQWVASFEDEIGGATGTGHTPEMAIVALEYQANKHGLWPHNPHDMFEGRERSNAMTNVKES
jgi:hypothetical protein